MARVSWKRYERVQAARELPELARVFAQRECYGEANDCSVISMSVAFGIPYNVAHDILAAAGRQKGKGMYFQTYLRNVAESGEMICGYKVTSVRCEALPSSNYGYTRRARWIYPSLQKVQRDFPKGRFILIKRGHAFTMLDGKVIDSMAATGRTQITNLFFLERA
jgi:hypothetical protein